MAIGDYDVLAHASQVLRDAPETGWAALEKRVIDAVRATPRGGWPIEVVDPSPGSAPGTIRVSDLVLKATIARALHRDSDIALTAIAADIDDEELRAVRIEVSGRYGTALPAAADRVRDTARAVVADLTGRDDVDVSVTVVDVHR